MGNSNQLNNNDIKNNERQGRGLFYGVVAIATFIIMAVGATFAYFAATAGSANTAITTGSTSLSLSLLSYESAWSKSDLIPVDTHVVRWGFEKQDDTTRKQVGKKCYDSSDVEVDCSSPDKDDSKTVIEYVDGNNNTMCVDDYGNSICSLYVFQVINDNASPQTMSINIVSEENTFENLWAMAYEISAPESGTAEDDAYNSDKNNNKTWEPGNVGFDDFTVMNGVTQVFDYTAVYVNRTGVTKTLLNYTVANDGGGSTTGEALDKKLISVEPGSASDENLSMRTTSVANGIDIDANETKTFAIVLYIHNLPYAQPGDEESIFKGSVHVTTGDGTTGVSGYISAAGSVGE